MKLRAAIAAALLACSGIYAVSDSAAATNGLPADLRARLATIEHRANADPGSEPVTATGQLLAAVAAGLPHGTIAKLEVGAPPRSWARQANAGAERWLFAATNAASASLLDTTPAAWTAELIAGAYRAAAKITGAPGLLGESTTVVFPNGRSSSPSEGIIGVPAVIPVHSEQWIRRRILKNAAKDKRIRDVQISFVHAFGPVPIVTVRFDPPDAFRITMDAVRPVFGDPFAYEGFLLRVVDGSGRLVRMVAMANGTGARFGVEPH